MTCRPVRVPSGSRNASGTVPITRKPSERQSPIARSFVSTTALNWIAVEALGRGPADHGLAQGAAGAATGAGRVDHEARGGDV